MRQMTMQDHWIDGRQLDKDARVEPEDALGEKLWKYGWGLLFVVAMTLLAEFGPRTVYSKVPPAPTVASQPAVHSIK